MVLSRLDKIQVIEDTPQKITKLLEHPFHGWRGERIKQSVVMLTVQEITSMKRKGNINFFNQKESYSEHWNAGVRGVKLWGLYNSLCSKPSFDATDSSVVPNELSNFSPCLLIRSLIIPNSEVNSALLRLQSMKYPVQIETTMKPLFDYSSLT